MIFISWVMIQFWVLLNPCSLEEIREQGMVLQVISSIQMYSMRLYLFLILIENGKPIQLGDNHLMLLLTINHIVFLEN